MTNFQIDANEAEDSWQEKYIAWILKVGRFLLNNIDEFIWDEYANHIMRTVLEATSGGVINHNKAKEAAAVNKQIENKKNKVPKELKILFKDYCETISTLPQLSGMYMLQYSMLLFYTKYQKYNA